MEEKHKSKIVWVLFIIIVALVGLNIYQWYMINNVEEIEIETATVAVVTSATPTATASVSATPSTTTSSDATANWQTYSNGDLGINFLYPSGATIKDISPTTNDNVLEPWYNLKNFNPLRLQLTLNDSSNLTFFVWNTTDFSKIKSARAVESGEISTKNVNGTTIYSFNPNIDSTQSTNSIEFIISGDKTYAVSGNINSINTMDNILISIQ